MTNLRLKGLDLTKHNCMLNQTKWHWKTSNHCITQKFLLLHWQHKVQAHAQRLYKEATALQYFLLFELII